MTVVCMKQSIIQRVSTICICACFLLCPANGKAQDEQQPSIKVRSEIHQGKVLLRWAPTNEKAWMLLNKYGVVLERETIVRDGKVLDDPETEILTGILKPVESDNLKKLVEEYPFGAIMAQAVFGKDFEVAGAGQADMATLVALGQEMQQRYVFSLYAADLCFPAAKEMGWGWEDTSVKGNERYLYRVVSQVPEEELSIENGALFVDMKNVARFPKALDFYASFSDGSVLLSWNHRTLSHLYAAYILERSVDGENFTPLSETPVTFLESGVADENAPFIYVDTLTNGNTCHYRVAGITPFGSMGAYSDVLSGKATAELATPPFITQTIPDEKGGADIEWGFDEVNENLITHFSIGQSPDNKTFTVIGDNIPKTGRHFHINQLPSAGYYVVTANTATGKKLSSFPVLLQATDTIPPAVPAGLEASIDSLGVVSLSWDANNDPDLYGYRVYKANTEGEEFVPLNDIAIKTTHFTDTVNIQMLNGKAFYTLTALDARYNQSGQSDPVEVVKPERIPPGTPFIRQVKVEDGKNTVYWESGGEETLKGYHVYRKNGKEGLSKKVATIDDAALRHYEDPDIENGQWLIYQVVAFTKGGLVSEFSLEYPVESINMKALENKIELVLTPMENKIRIKWSSAAKDILSVQLFKAEGGSPFALFRDGLQNNEVIDDTQVLSGASYKYMLLVKTKGSTPQTIEKRITL